MAEAIDTPWSIAEAQEGFPGAAADGEAVVSGSPSKGLLVSF
jgi:hypothetical protein